MKKITLLVTFICAILFISSSISQELKRTDVDDRYKWNLADMYNSLDEWKAGVNTLGEKTDEIASYKGKLGMDAATMYEAISLYFDMLKTFYIAATYSNNLYNEDLSISKNQALSQEIQSIGTKFSEATAYMDPEILSIPSEKIKKFFDEKPELEEYSTYIDNIQRLRKHTLTEAEEKILASFGLTGGTTSSVYNIFNNAEKPAPKVTLSTGVEVSLTPSSYTRYRAVANREDRIKVFEAFFNSYGDFENTLGANLAGKVKRDYVYAKNRNYETALEYALNGDNLPVSVYTTLIEQVNKNLPTLHRFLDLKKRMLGVDELHYYDLYTPVVEKVEMNFTVDKGEEILKEALKPLGNEYVSTLDKAFTNRWIDYYPTLNKRSGAYSTGGAYDVHPYILMNWNDDYESVSTLAHELGHTMHSFFSNTHQPFAKADYATFVAEIASTLNENLLNDYMVRNAKSDEEKLSLLGSYLELLRTTIFRQTSFAEFEWEIHKRVENGEPITGEEMSNIYYDIVKRYYGNDEGHCVVDDYIKYEWAYIPHFLNYTYYVFQYSTSLIYGTAITEKILNEGDKAVKDYYKILKGGGSKYAVDLIKDAGIDPLSSEPVEFTMQRMNRVMDQIEEILDKKNK